MKKYLLLTPFIGLCLQAQQYSVPQITNGYKHLLEKKDVYYHSHADMKEPYTIERYTYNDDYTQINKYELKKTDGQGGYYINYIENFVYDNKNRLIESETQENVNGSYKNNLKTHYTYNTDGTINYIYTELWDEDKNKYKLNRKYTFKYENGNKKPSQIKWQYGDYYNAGQWNDMFIDYYTYNSNNEPLNIIRRYTESNGNEYLNRKTYTYNNQGQRVKMLLEKFSSSRGWYDHYKYEITYDNDGNVTEKNTYSINAQGDWEVNLRYTALEHNTNLLRKDTYIFQGKDYFTGEKEVLFPSKNVVAAYDAYEYIRNTQSYRKLTHNEFEFLEDELSVNDIKAKDGNIEVYPNPVYDIFTLNTKNAKGSVAIYNMSGQRVKFFSHLQSSYDVRTLPKGVYILVLKTNNIEKRSKFIKQ